MPRPPFYLKTVEFVAILGCFYPLFSNYFSAVASVFALGPRVGSPASRRQANVGTLAATCGGGDWILNRDCRAVLARVGRANFFTEQWIRPDQYALLQKEEAHYMTPVITAVKPEAQSKGLDRARCCWHVGYEFCGLNAEIAVYANDEAEARSRAVEQLRTRGLKIAV